jgi:hypothetical protein
VQLHMRLFPLFGVGLFSSMGTARLSMDSDIRLMMQEGQVVPGASILR